MASLVNEQLCINCGLCESTMGCPIGAITRGHTVEELLARKGKVQ